MASDSPTTPGLDRKDLLRLGGMIVALVAIVGVVLLAGGGGGADEVTTGRSTGVLTAVGDTRLVLRTTDGKNEEYAIRPEDRRNLDMFHLQQHSADALPSIVHYEQQGNTRYVVRVDDA
jgi:hypothetical protein